MLIHPILNQLTQLRCLGMAEAYQEQLQQSDLGSLSFDERLGLMVDRESIRRDNRRFKQRLQQASFKQQACVQDIDYKTPRGLNQSVMQKLLLCNWIRQHENLLITGLTGTGKTFIATALGHQACLSNYSVKYIRCTHLFQTLAIARGDGSYHKFIQSLNKMQVLILDDWGSAPMDDLSRRDLLEIMEDRYKTLSTIVTSQLPLALWHGVIGDPTLADSILDRLVHNAHKIELSGDSLRKQKCHVLEPNGLD